MFKNSSKPKGPESRPCFGYKYANDPWNPESVHQLRQGLAAQDIERDKATAVVIGAGTLPYSLGYLGVLRVILLDRKAEVINGVKDRVAALQQPEANDWDSWYEYVRTGLPRTDRLFFKPEYRIATESGLVGDYAATQKAAQDIELRERHENLITGFPALAEELRDEGQEVSFLNVTNVAHYLRYDGKGAIRYEPGRRALRECIKDLPFAAGAIIAECRSSVQVHLATDYLNQV